MSARGRIPQRVYPGGHIGPPLRGGGGVPNQRKIGAKTGPCLRGGTEPAPYRGSGAGRCVRRRGAPGVWLPPAKFRNGSWGVSPRHRPLRPAGGRGTARRVVVPYGWLRRAAAIALASGAQRSVCARGREEIGGKRSRNHPRRGHQRRTIPQSRLRRASSLCTREPFPAGDGGIGRGMRIAASLRSSQ